MKDANHRFRAFFSRLFFKKKSEPFEQTKTLALLEFKKKYVYKKSIKKKGLVFSVLKKSEKSVLATSWKNLVAVGFVLVAAIGFFGNQNITAWQIDPGKGLVKLIRDGKIEIVTKPQKLSLHDQVQVFGRQPVKITSNKGTVSKVSPNTKLQLLGSNEIFLEKGSLDTQSQHEFEISTARGVILPQASSDFQIEVSDIGEAKIVTKNDALKVFQYTNEKNVLELDRGDKVVLRGDMNLKSVDRVLLQDISLSDQQILAIKARLLIAKTKLLRSLGKADFSDQKLSAEKTFSSILQILYSLRNLEIAVPKAIEIYSREEIYEQLTQKTTDKSLLLETRALMDLFKLVEKYHGKFGFQVPTTRNESLNRYALIQRIFQNAPEFAVSQKILQQSSVFEAASDILDKSQENPKEVVFSQYKKKLDTIEETPDFLRDLSAGLSL